VPTRQTFDFCVLYFVRFEIGENFVAQTVWVSLDDVMSSAPSGWSITVPERLTMTVSPSPSELLISVEIKRAAIL
jgi:hypothetical protein